MTTPILTPLESLKLTSRITMSFACPFWQLIARNVF
jgi:hypothetical protein